jgi:hypothetical protein
MNNEAKLKLTPAQAEALLGKLPEKKKLNPPVYGGPMVFDDDHDVKAGFNKAIDQITAIIRDSGK